MSDSGGMTIIRPGPISYTDKSEVGLMLMSDLHFGANNVDYDLINQELAVAKKNGDRILFNGDLFDGILTKDFKRYEPDVLHPRLRGSKDIVNCAVDWAAEVLMPYANNIDLIGWGNHENSVVRHNNVDMVKLLIDKIEHKKNIRINYGGFTGFLDYRFRYKHVNSKDSGKRYILYFHHGSGGAGSAGSAVGEILKKNWVEADLIWLGHKHHRFNLASRVMRCPQAGDDPVLQDVRYVMTGAYIDNYKGQTQSDIAKSGRKSNYGADSGCEPQGKGGARVILTFTSHKKPIKVTVVQ